MENPAAAAASFPKEIWLAIAGFLILFVLKHYTIG